MVNWIVSTIVLVHVECVSPAVCTRPARLTAAEPWFAVTSAPNHVPTSVHRVADPVRTDAITVTVQKNADVLVNLVASAVSGTAVTSSALDCATSRATDPAVINLVPDVYRADIRVSGFVEKRVPRSAESVTATR